MMENYIKIEHNEYGDLHYLNSKNLLHRLDGPAYIWPNGRKEWCFSGLLHRLNGPAIDYGNENKYWYLKGVFYSKTKHNRLVLFHFLEPRRIDINPTEDD